MTNPYTISLDIRNSPSNGQDGFTNTTTSDGQTYCYTVTSLYDGSCESGLSNILCATPGNITVTNMPADYEYQLLDATNGNVLVPFSAGNGPSFDIATNGAYTIEMRQQGVIGGCIFRLEDIGVLRRDFQVDIATQDADCNGLGAISISVLDANPQYYYEISQGGSVVDTFGPSADNNYTFQNVNTGTFDVRVTTDDGCLYTEQVVIQDLSHL